MFRFSTEKIIEAVAVLVALERTKTISRLRLLKLLYIADRESIRETGRPIVGTKVCAMRNGPVHSEIYDLIKGQHRDEPLWGRHFRTDGYRIELAEDPGRSRLSRYEIAKLTDVSERRAYDDDWDVAAETHDFPEYQKNYREGTSTPIPFEDILEGVGRSADRAAVLQDARDKAVADELFGT